MLRCCDAAYLERVDDKRVYLKGKQPLRSVHDAVLERALGRSDTHFQSMRTHKKVSKPRVLRLREREDRASHDVNG